VLLVGDLDGVPNEALTLVAPAFGTPLISLLPAAACRLEVREAVASSHSSDRSDGDEAYTRWYTSLVAKTVAVREFRTNLSTLLSDVADRRDHVLVTRNGKPAAALVPIDEYDALEETAEILSDSETLAAIEAGVAELSRGETVTLEDLRGELDARRSTR
jgi:antitoxin YefM